MARAGVMVSAVRAVCSGREAGRARAQLQGLGERPAAPPARLRHVRAGGQFTSELALDGVRQPR